MKVALRYMIASMLIFSFAGCATTHPFKEDKELNALVLALVRHNAEMKKKRAEQQGKGIKALGVVKPGDDFIVSADLDNASIPEVVRRLFDETGMPYLFDRTELYGNITARFEDRPFPEALNLILKPIMLSAGVTDGIMVISSGQEEGGKPPDTVHTEVSLKNLDTNAAKQLLDGLYPMKAKKIPRVYYGPVASSNTLYLSGSRNEVARAVQLLMKADREIRHVVIEVLVVEFNSGALEDMGTKISKLQDGKYENFNMDYSNTAGDIITFSKFAPGGTLANHLTSFTAVINLMISDNKARLISRPYISTLSGKKAQLEIASDRYVIVDDASGRASAKSIKAVHSPVHPPVDAPVHSPVDASVHSPVDASVHSPVDSPVHSPVDSPTDRSFT